MAEGPEMDDLLNQAPCGFFLFSDDGTLLAVNVTLRDWLGYGPGMLEGGHVQTILSPGGRVFYQTHLFPLLKLHGRADEIYLALRPQSGGEVPVLVNAIRRERVGAFVSECVCLPMWRRSRYEDEILQARRAAELATREKSLAYDALALAQEELAAQQEELLAANLELRARAAREALLGRIGQVIRTATDPREVLEAAVRELGQALGVDRCYFANEDADIEAAGPEWRRPVPTSVSGGRGRPAHLRVPLTAGADRITLCAERADGRGDWEPDEITLAEAVATLTQGALESVRARRREHNIAEQLQEALQPPLPAYVPGLELAKHYEAALEEAGVGGDFWDVFPVAPGCTALAVGDLSGKGLAAAAQVATVRNMLRYALYSQPVLAEAVTDLNRIVTRNELLTGFATLWVGRHDAATGELTYVNLGQEPALLRRAASGEVESLLPTGPVLGATETARYQERAVTLRPGDALAVFTDGATECGPNRREMLGITGLEALLRPPFAPANAEEVVRRLAEAVCAAAYGGRAKDDVCILAAVAERTALAGGHRHDLPNRD